MDSADRPFDDRPSTIFGLCITLTVCLYLSTGARLYARFFVTRSPGWDDLFVVVTLLAFTLLSVATCNAVRWGLGKHTAALSKQHASDIILTQYLLGIAYTCSTATIKISLLLQYLRVFLDNTFTRRFAQCILVLVSLWGFAMLFMSFFSCFPDPSAFWKMTFKGCYGFASPNMNEIGAMIKSHAAVNVFFDLSVFSMAIRLQFVDGAPTHKKGMIAILCMGLVSCSFAIWRLIDIIENWSASGMDPAFNLAGPALLSVGEIYLAAMCATIPFFWPYVVKQLDKIFVMYEFNISTEHRVREDEIELAHIGTLPAQQSRGVSDDTRSVETLSGDIESGQQSKSHYADPFVQKQVSVFKGESAGDEIVPSGTTAMATSNKPKQTNRPRLKSLGGQGDF